MRRSTLVVIIAGIVVLAVLWMALSSSKLALDTNDADYEATITMHYSDGSEAKIKKLKSASAYHDDKEVSFVEFDLDVKWKAKTGGTVRVLSPKDDAQHASKVRITFDDGLSEKKTISEYPLSYYTNYDYSVLEEGTWYHLFKGIKVTMLELEGKIGKVLSQTWSLTWRVDVYYNLDPEEPEYKRHELVFTVPMKVIQFTPADDDGGGGGGGARPPPDGIPFDDPIQPQKPIYTVTQHGTQDISEAVWMVGGKPKDDATDADRSDAWRR